MLQNTLRFALIACLLTVFAPLVMPYVVDMAAGVADRPDGRIPTAAGYRAETDRRGATEAAFDLGGRSVALRADGRGHFEAEAQVNGRPLDVLVDTGASSVVLRYEDAQRLALRIDPNDFRFPVSTANGVAKAARITLADVRIGDVRVQNVDAMVMPRGLLGANLLGMSFIKRLGRFEMRGERLVLVQ
jgi:aspartyl protease family protein